MQSVIPSTVHSSVNAELSRTEEGSQRPFSFLVSTEGGSLQDTSLSKGSKKELKKKKGKAKSPTSCIIINTANTRYDVIKDVSKKVMGWRCNNHGDSEEFDVYWSDLGVLSDKLTKLKSHQKINHFPAMYNITRKNYLAKNLKRLERVFPNDYKFFPQTWLLPTEYAELRNQFHKKKHFTLIVKPEASS